MITNHATEPVLIGYQRLVPKTVKGLKTCLTMVTNKEINRKSIKFHAFPDSAHQAESEQHQNHIHSDENFPHHGPRVRLTDIHDKVRIHQNV